MAGEEKAIDILTVDMYGHATAQDGSAQITVNIVSGTDIFPGKSGRERAAAHHEAHDPSRYSKHNMMHNVFVQSWSLFHNCHQPTGVSFTVYKFTANTQKSKHSAAGLLLLQLQQDYKASNSSHSPCSHVGSCSTCISCNLASSAMAARASATKINSFNSDLQLLPNTSKVQDTALLSA